MRFEGSDICLYNLITIDCCAAYEYLRNKIFFLSVNNVIFVACFRASYKTLGMDFDKTSILIKKIKSLHEGLKLAPSINAIEKDLLLNYISELHQTVQDEPTEPVVSASVLNTPTVVEPTPIAPEMPVFDAVEPEEYAIEEEFEMASAPIIEEVVESSNQVDESVEISDFIADMNAEINDTMLVEEIVPPVEPAVIAETPAYTPTNEVVMGAYGELFEEENSTDLSAKLASKPIADIYTGLSINDRFLVLKELFAGDKAAFSIAIDRLNDFSNFEEAKQLIIKELAPHYDWLTDQKVKKAKNFIQTIKRRYL